MEPTAGKSQPEPTIHTRSSPHRRSWTAVVATLFVATAFRSLGCGAETNDPSGDNSAELAALLDDFGGEALLDGLGEDLLYSTYASFATEAGLLEEATEAWQEEAQQGEASTHRDAAREAWFAAMAVWQTAEVLQVGPAGSSIAVLGGEDLRDAIYSWPSVNPCRVDQELVEGVWDEAEFFASNLVNVYGLDAIERLLFFNGETNACLNDANINTDGSWNTLVASGLEVQRASFARALAADVANKAQALAARWEPGSGDLAGALSGAGGEGTPYANRAEALTAVFHALFYVELTTKDLKLARPLGIQDCNAKTCPEDFESQFADASLDHVRQNLRAAAAVIDGPNGGASAGLSHLLVHVGEEDVAMAVSEALVAVEEALDAAPTSALEGIESDPEALIGVYNAVKDFTDLLKGDLALALFLDLPQEAAGDSD